MPEIWSAWVPKFDCGVEEAIVDDYLCHTSLVALTVMSLLVLVSIHLPLLLLVDGVHP